MVIDGALTSDSSVLRLGGWLWFPCQASQGVPALSEHCGILSVALGCLRESLGLAEKLPGLTWARRSAGARRPISPRALTCSLWPSQVYIRTPSGEVQTVLVQDSPPATAAATSTTACSSPASRTSHLSGTSKKHSAAILRKERPLPKIAPAGSIISLNAAQLAAAAQAMQTININGVQVQGVPVTITNTGGEGRPPMARGPGMGTCGPALGSQ